MALGFGFNKAKVLASAEKFVQQGKLQNAIAEYEKVAREDAKDVTVLNTIGDLYARLGDNEHAVHYFKRVGDQYELRLLAGMSARTAARAASLACGSFLIGICAAMPPIA